MERFRKKRDLQLVLLGGIVVLVAALAYQFFLLHATTQEMFASNRRQLTSYLLANELRQSSDDLTRLARTYAVTGDSLYARQYQMVLDIRNGVVARPQQYHRAYWDFVTEEGFKPRPDSDEKTSLQTLMKKAGFSEKEFLLLSEAEQRSNDLVKLETRAMHAVNGEFEDGRGGYSRRGAPDLELARNLMHSKEYHRIKAGIMTPLNDFFAEMERRTASEVGLAQAELDRAQKVFLLLLLLTLGAIVLLVYNGRRQTMAILGGRPEELEDILSTLAAGNLSVRLQRRQEGSVYNLVIMTVEGLRELIVQVQEGSRAMNAGIASLTATAETIRSDSNEILGIVEHDASTIEQITVSIDHIAGNADEVRKSVEKTGTNADDSVQAVVNVAGKVRSMESTVLAVGRTIETLSTRSTEISSIISVIRGIAEQTNLLALNAAIEAARAGEKGRGFAVVADEVRKLAERSSLATVDIAEKIENIRQDTETTLNDVRMAVAAAKVCVDSTDAAMTQISEIQQQMQAVVAATHQIAHGTREQSLAVTEIAKSIEQLSERTHSTNQQINQSSEVSAALDKSAQALTRTISRFTL